MQAAIAADRDAAFDAMREAAVAAAAVDARRAEASAALERVTEADRELEGLRVAIAEKRAMASAESVKV